MISVVIPAYNAERTIEACLGSLRRQSFAGRREVVVVDSSTDGTPDLVAARFPEVTLVHLERRTDPGTARNLGIERTSGEILAFLDADCTAAEDWLERIQGAHEAGYRAAGGAVLNGNGAGDLVGLCGYMLEFREFLPQRPRREALHVPTCNLSYDRRLLERYGPFRGEYYPQEDLVYNRRLLDGGEKILFDPGMRVAHHHRSGLGDFLAHQRLIGRTTARVMRALRLPGWRLARHPLGAALAVPFLVPLKLSRTLLAFLGRQPRVALRLPLLVPLLALGLASWGRGFVRGAGDPAAPPDGGG